MKDKRLKNPNYISSLSGVTRDKFKKKGMLQSHGNNSADDISQA